MRLLARCTVPYSSMSLVELCAILSLSTSAITQYCALAREILIRKLLLQRSVVL
ncbi:hypothetical protein [Nostoc sp. DedSLP04]|uniref:hypothetical protein n=1 Tax=Nostoc sp. DedSLP04 TaxID=3075401 RepID=UPI003A103565